MSLGVALCLALAVLSAWIAAAALWRLRTPLERLHAVTFVNVAGGGAVLLAAGLTDGLSPRVLKCAAIWLAILLIGALVSLLEVVKRGEEDTLPSGLDDHEAQRLLRFVQDETGSVPLEIVELTHRAALAVEAEIWTELDALEAWRDMDVAVFTGVQIHVPERFDHVWPIGASIKGADGERRPLDV